MKKSQYILPGVLVIGLVVIVMWVFVPGRTAVDVSYQNYQDIQKKLRLSARARTMLAQNGFVATPYPKRQDDFVAAYAYLKEKAVPIFITSDTLLHLYHVQFDETLKTVEEQTFYNDLWDMSQTLAAQMKSIQKESSSPLVREAARTNTAYFSVVLEQLKPEAEQRQDRSFSEDKPNAYAFTVPDDVRGQVAEENALIEAHRGFAASPIFSYQEDYSQYVPCGHYTRSEKLKNYFKAFMYLGRMGFLLKGGCADCLVSEPEAEKQTLQALLIANELKAHPDLMKRWQRIYDVTSYYVGTADDLTPIAYIEAMNDVFGGRLNYTAADSAAIKKLKRELAQKRLPAIYGGIGDCTVRTDLPAPLAEQADQCLASTQGMRLMGQRFVPDSWMMSQLVSPPVGKYLGETFAFTTVTAPSGDDVKGFPRGLEVMALLGSERAKELVDQGGDSNYQNYQPQFSSVKAEIDAFTDADWGKNAYWSWLRSLQALMKTYDSAFPPFMRSRAWEDKQLNATLASWAELRHDTILFVKQSYTFQGLGAAGPNKPVKPKLPVVGYIEPVPEFYERLLALTRDTNTKLSRLNVLDDSGKDRLDRLEVLLTRVLELSRKELQNNSLTGDDYEFIEYFAGAIAGAVSDVGAAGTKTTLIADVHTDGNTKQVLEEGGGYLDLLVVGYSLPDGRKLLGAGPIMSYYEFKHPMSDRLTDEEWRKKLGSFFSKPSRPTWVENFQE